MRSSANRIVQTLPVATTAAAEAAGNVLREPSAKMAPAFAFQAAPAPNVVATAAEEAAANVPREPSAKTAPAFAFQAAPAPNVVATAAEVRVAAAPPMNLV